MSVQYNKVEETLENDLDNVAGIMGTLEDAGTSIDTVHETVAPSIGKQTPALPDELKKIVDVNLKEWTDKEKVRRLWERDPWLWTGKDEAFWLDWLDIPKKQMDNIGELKRVLEASDGKYTKHLVLLGMGGSSLAPNMLRNTFGQIGNHPDLLILDSTDPAQIRQIEKQIDYKTTKFVVSSKSGSTLEPNIFKDYFFTQASKSLGSKEEAANNFFAITDPGSSLQKLAEKDGFRTIFFGVPGIGGRYSALSNFGMVPASAMGIDIEKFLELTIKMVDACGKTVAPADNPGVHLGIILGSACVSGRDKVTLIASPGIHSIGAWLEQLLAESTGKEGKGIIPVDKEALLDPEQYGDDRIFAYLRLSSAPDAKQDEAVEKLLNAGFPVIRIDVPDIYNVGQEFFRWEIATAVAGSIIGINAFNQPDVESSKIVTREMTEQYEKTGSLPPESPILEENGLALYTDDKNAAQLHSAAGENAMMIEMLKAHLNRLEEGDYFAILGYINRLDPEHEKIMQEIRTTVQNAFGTATCLGFGPRFLHSTGQAYKGGPNTGVFLQITCDDAEDLEIPNRKYTFGVVKAAQARGDFNVLADRSRRALRVHLGKDTKRGLRQLRDLITDALG